MAIVNLGLMGNQHIPMKQIKKDYQKMLDPLKERFWSKELTCAPLMIGSKYKANDFKLMYIGRALNGWTIPWKQGTTKDLVEQVFENAIDMKLIQNGIVEYMDGDKKKEYNYNRSPFWQLCHALMKQYGKEENWSDSIAWSNLYKVSPYGEGNPDNKIIKETINDCAKILRDEILEIKPTHIVFVTGSWWYSPKEICEKAFSNEIGVEITEDENSVILGSGKGNFSFVPKIVITNRPESSHMTREQHAKAIKDAFENIDS